MAYTFYKAQGMEIGNSLLDEASLDFCRKIVNEAGSKLVLPVDCIVADGFSNDAQRRTVPINEIPAGCRVWISVPDGAAVCLRY